MADTYGATGRSVVKSETGAKALSVGSTAGVVAKPAPDMKLRLDIIPPVVRDSRDSCMSFRDGPGHQEALRMELDQQFLRWCAEETTPALITDLLATVKTLPKGATLDYQASLARVRSSTASTSTTVVSPGSRAVGLLLSPRGSKGHFTSQSHASPGASSLGTPASSSPSPANRSKSTPPMSPTSNALGTSGGFRASSMSPGSNKSPPTSPRHFTCKAHPNLHLYVED
jgi:hypothetical protein